MITIVGLGPACAGGMSVSAREAVRAAPRRILRTARHPAVDDLIAEGMEFESLDALYESASDFETLYDRVAEAILDAAQSSDVAFAVPGHPLVADESVRRLISRARELGIPVRIVGSESFLEPTLAALGRSLTDGLLMLDALSVDRLAPRVDTDALLFQVYDRDVASAVKLSLMQHYPDDWPVSVVRAAGSGETTVETVPLHRLDRVAIDHLTTVYVPALPEDRRKKSFADLVRVMARLRGEGGCPWDREQNHATLKRYLIEECYELIEAIDADDMDALMEELGDVLLQVVFHAQLEAEIGTFGIDDVIAHIVEKLIRRHPHVFGDLSVEDSDEVLRNWEKIKREEKGESWRTSVLDGVPSELPALMRALEISKRAVKVGFEWERLDDVLAKLDEEVRELRDAIGRGDSVAVASEVGDLLFTVVNVARWQKVDAEDALRTMLQRFSTRFRYIEDAARARGRPLEDLSLTEMDSLWDEAKLARQ